MSSLLCRQVLNKHHSIHHCNFATRLKNNLEGHPELATAVGCLWVVSFANFSRMWINVDLSVHGNIESSGANSAFGVKISSQLPIACFWPLSRLEHRSIAKNFFLAQALFEIPIKPEWAFINLFRCSQYTYYWHQSPQEKRLSYDMLSAFRLVQVSGLSVLKASLSDMYRGEIRLYIHNQFQCKEYFGFLSLRNLHSIIKLRSLLINYIKNIFYLFHAWWYILLCHSVILFKQYAEYFTCFGPNWYFS